MTTLPAVPQFVSSRTVADFSSSSSPDPDPATVDDLGMVGRAKVWRSVLLKGEMMIGEKSGPVLADRILHAMHGRSEEGVRFPANIFAVPLDQPNQRVIKYDCDRTRAGIEEFKQPEVRAAMEAILTFYCKSQNLKYKQGMNELLAPFVYLKAVHALSSWPECYNMYSAFISVFLPDMFVDEEFLFLQRSCVLFKSALRYHAPALSARLDAALVTPEMYVTPWFLTLFASKTALPTIFRLWDLLISEGDKHSSVFLCISLCVSHARILRSSTKSSLPETITKIAITEDSVAGAWKRAVKMRQHTPPYFVQQLVNAAEFHRLDSLAPHIEKQVGESYPLLLRPMDLFRRDSVSREGWKFLVLDCRPSWMMGLMGSLPLSIPFDLESFVANQTVFPVADALKRVADIIGVDLSQSIPQWPVENHICLMGLSDAVIDAIGLLFVALAKFSNVPRVSILKGGFQAVHADLPQELIDHDPATCPLCNHIPIHQVQNRPRASSSSSYSSSASPVSTGGGMLGALTRFRTFVSDSSASSAISFGSRLLVGVTPPLPTSRCWLSPDEPLQFVSKCKLAEVMGRAPSSDIEANALLVVGAEFIRCFAAPLDMTVLTNKCELRMYGNWRMCDLVKVTSRNNQPSMLLLYFSVAAAPDLIISVINADIARTVVDDVRRKYRASKKQIP